MIIAAGSVMNEPRRGPIVRVESHHASGVPFPSRANAPRSVSARARTGRRRRDRHDDDDEDRLREVHAVGDVGVDRARTEDRRHRGEERDRPDAEDHLHLAEEMEDLHAEAVSPGAALGLDLLPQVMRRGHQPGGEEGVNDREEEDRRRDEVHRIDRDPVDQHLDQAHPLFTRVRREREREPEVEGRAHRGPDSREPAPRPVRPRRKARRRTAAGTASARARKTPAAVSRGMPGALRDPDEVVVSGERDREVVGPRLPARPEAPRERHVPHPEEPPEERPARALPLPLEVGGRGAPEEEGRASDLRAVPGGRDQRDVERRPGEERVGRAESAERDRERFHGPPVPEDQEENGPDREDGRERLLERHRQDDGRNGEAAEENRSRRVPQLVDEKRDPVRHDREREDPAENDRVFQKAGNLEEAESIYRIVMEAEPSDPRASLRSRRSSEAQGRRDRRDRYPSQGLRAVRGGRRRQGARHGTHREGLRERSDRCGPAPARRPAGARKGTVRVSARAGAIGGGGGGTREGVRPP